jgi:hypothetical protein
MADFSKLKKQSNLGSLTSKLVQEVEKLNSGNSSADDRLWKPTMGKDGVGSAIIRFLPAPGDEELPWVKMWHHGFKGPGGWYIENSLTTIAKADPLAEYNRERWQEGEGSEGQKFVRNQSKRKLSYYSNIYVIKDPATPENEGKVFLFKYGKKIFDKILNAMQPEFEDEEPINPFDFWQGANFRLKIRKVEGYWNYDKSEFDSINPLLDDDDAMEAIWKKEYSLAAVTAPDQFKSYEELQKRLNYVLGINKPTPKNSTQDEEEAIEETYSSSKSSEEEVLKELESSYKKSKSFSKPAETKDGDEDEDDYMKKFQDLLDD